ncbi:hypothetical protein AOQ84DRAFT_267528, partial [Glonium stellatum]
VVNQCLFSVFLWSVDTSIGPMQTITSGSSYYETMHWNPTTGIALKITTTPDGLYNAAPTLIWGYAINPSEKSVYYSLSDAFGNPFVGQSVSLSSNPDGACPNISYPSERSTTKVCQDIYDLVITLC